MTAAVADRNPSCTYDGPGGLFQAFPKIARWNREVVITEKLDGTNAAVGVTESGLVYAQSRKRVIDPEKDNFGFARWVWSHAAELRDGLGPGLHFGEWWGQGIGRGYGLDEKRFSLFNTSRWTPLEPALGDYRCAECPICFVVPVLATYDGPSRLCFDVPLSRLRSSGSIAAPGFDRPEGIVIYHTAANTLFKVTCEKDEKPKGAPGV